MNSFAAGRSAVCPSDTRINNVCIVSEGHTAKGSLAKEFIPSRRFPQGKNLAPQKRR